MKIFIGFILICFVGATVLRKRDIKTSVYMLCTLTLLVSIGYFFFKVILISFTQATRNIHLVKFSTSF